MANKLKKPVLFLTLGFPGSGKTYFSERWAKDLNLLHIRASKLRKIIFEKPQHNKLEHRQMRRVMQYILAELLKTGASVICDFNANLRKSRAEFRKVARAAGADSLLVWIQTPFALTQKRVKLRNKYESGLKNRHRKAITQEILYEMRDSLQPPVREKYLVLDGTRAYRASRRRLMNYLRSNKYI